MTDLAGMPSYFWLTSSRLRKPLQDDVPFTTQALRQDLTRVRIAWDECQSKSRSQRNLRLFNRCVRPGDVVGGKRSRRQQSTLGPAAAAVRVANF